VRRAASGPDSSFVRSRCPFGPALLREAAGAKISQLVDVPNMLVSAFLPEDIFTG
jgi:hypothetical protein